MELQILRNTLSYKNWMQLIKSHVFVVQDLIDSECSRRQKNDKFLRGFHWETRKEEITWTT